MPAAERQQSDGRHVPVTVPAPSQTGAERAAAVVRLLDAIKAAHPSRRGSRRKASGACALIGPDGETVVLPETLLKALRTTAEILAAGGGAAIVPVEKELTTQEAAGLLNMSRQYLVRLLDANEIPHHRVNTHRRIKLGDLLTFKTKRDARRRKALRELTRITEDSDALDSFPHQNGE
jgi:excisionase family DNA binding protein